MNRWWLLLAILIAIANDAAEMTQEQAQVSGVTIAKTSAVPYDHHDLTVAETSTYSIGVETSYDTTTTTTTAAQETEAIDELRNRVTRLTNELSKAIVAFTIAQHREQRMVALEKSKYEYGISSYV